MIGKYQVRETGISGKALLQTGDKELVCYRKGRLHIYDIGTGKEIKQICLPVKHWKRTCCKIRLLERLLHMDARWAVQTGKGSLLLQFDHKVFSVDIMDSKVYAEKVPVLGNPLSVAVVKGNPGFCDCLLVGDYTRNPKRETVSLYARDSDGNWNKVYEFAEKTVRHIHGCVSDPQNQCVYILTGDEDQESGIWKATDNFHKVEPLLVGSQQYRACQMLIGKDALYYFTDAPSEKNYMYEISKGKVRKLKALNGTCIYGTQWEDGGGGSYSVTCEPDAHTSNKLQYWFSNVPGRGIKGKKVEVFAVEGNGEMAALCCFEHDGLPLRLFQYGTVTFTNAVGNRCYFTPMCVRGKDMHVYEIVKNR